MKRDKTPLTYRLLSQYRGVLMGVSIIFIMIFHFLEDRNSGKVMKYLLEKAFFKGIGSSNVDIFIILSGLGLYYSLKKNRDLLQFYKRRIIKILVPYILVAFPAAYWRQVLHYHEGIGSFLKIVAVPLYSMWFWYIWLIGFCYLIFPYVFDIFESAGNRIMEQMYLVSCFTALIVFSLLLKLYAPDIFKKAEIALLRVPWLFVGCLLGKAAYEGRKMGAEVIAFFVVSCAMLPLGRAGSSIITRNVRACINLCFCFVIVMILKKGSESGFFAPVCRWGAAILETFGRYSLELYLTHVAIRGVFHALGYPTYHLKGELCMILSAVLAAFLLKQVCGFLEKKLFGLSLRKA